MFTKVLNPHADETTILEITKRYANHPSTVKIKSSIFDIDLLDFPEARRENINSIEKSLNPSKATGPDLIPLKMIKSPENIIEAHLTTSIINVDLSDQIFEKC